jgi:hypothetical protein
VLADVIEYRVTLLRGQQEVPPNGSAGFGCGTFLIDTCANTVDYYIVFTDLSAAEVGAHIHGPAAPGTNGGVVHALPAGSPKVGSWTYDESVENDLLQGNLYVNIHTTAFPAGEIRGQISSHVAIIDDDQEVPPNASGSSGWGVFFIDTSAHELHYYVDISGLAGTETAAHIHGYAPHGASAGPLHTLPPGNPKIGTWAYPAADETPIMDGRAYVNIHTTAFPNGEMRGQIVPIVVPMDGTQENPPVSTPAAGCGLFSLDRANDVLGYDIRVTNLIGTEAAAHIHGFAGRGANAGVLTALPAPAVRKLGAWGYNPGDEESIQKGETYVNIHTTAVPTGEVRGQIEFPVTPCPGDLNRDGVVDLSDLADLLGTYGQPGGECEGDVDGNGIIDLPDLAALLATYGVVCP